MWLLFCPSIPKILATPLPSVQVCTPNCWFPNNCTSLYTNQWISSQVYKSVHYKPSSFQVRLSTLFFSFVPLFYSLILKTIPYHSCNFSLLLNLFIKKFRSSLEWECWRPSLSACAIARFKHTNSLSRRWTAAASILPNSASRHYNTRTDSPLTTLECPNCCKKLLECIRGSREADVFNYSVVVEDEHRLYTCSVDFERKSKAKDGRKMKGQITTRYMHKYRLKEWKPHLFTG